MWRFYVEACGQVLASANHYKFVMIGQGQFFAGDLGARGLRVCFEASFSRKRKDDGRSATNFALQRGRAAVKIHNGFD